MFFVDFPQDLKGIFKLVDSVKANEPMLIKNAFGPVGQDIFKKIADLRNDPSIPKVPKLYAVLDNTIGNLNSTWNSLYGDITSENQAQIVVHFEEFKKAFQTLFNFYVETADTPYRLFAQERRLIPFAEMSKPLNYAKVFEEIKKVEEAVETHLSEGKLDQAFATLAPMPSSIDKAELLKRLGTKALQLGKLSQALLCYRLFDPYLASLNPAVIADYKAHFKQSVNNWLAFDKQMLNQAFEEMKKSNYPDEKGLFIKLSEEYLFRREYTEAYHILCVRIELLSQSMEHDNEKIDLAKQEMGQPLQNILNCLLKEGKSKEAIEMAAYLQKFYPDFVKAFVFYGNTFGMDDLGKAFQKQFSNETEVLKDIGAQIEKCIAKQNDLTSLLVSNPDSDEEEMSGNMIHKKNNEKMDVDDQDVAQMITDLSAFSIRKKSKQEE